MPTLQENVGVLLTYGIQSDINTVASAGGTSQRIRRTQHSLNGQKNTFQSQEVRPDQQIYDMRHGARRVAGSIDGELSTVSWDDFFAALMRNTWTAGVTLDESDFTSLAIAASTGVVTLGSGNPSTLGLRIGDIIDLTNMSVSGNNTRYRITAMTATTFTIIKTSDGSVPAENTTDTACNIAVVGRKITFGTAKTAFTIEETHTSIDIARMFYHMRLGGASIRLPPNGIATVSWEFMGRDFANLPSASAPYFTNATAAPTTDLLTGLEGGLRLNGAERAVVTGLDINISHQLNTTEVIGDNKVPDIFYGTITITGNLSFYVEDEELLDVFSDETVVDLTVVAMGADGTFLTFNMQRVKLGGANASPGGDGGFICQAPFQALLQAAATGKDATTLTIQRSNS